MMETKEKTMAIRSRMNKLASLLALGLVLPVMGMSKAEAAPCVASDLTLTIDYTTGSTTYVASDCADLESGSSGGIAGQLERLVEGLELTGLGFQYLDKTGDGSAPGGISFVVTAPQSQSGQWTVSWTEQPGAPDLPLLIDFALLINGSTSNAGYLFTDVLLPITPNTGTGDFAIRFLNPGGNIPNLSHMLLAGGNPRTPPPTEVPIAGSLLLMGIGGVAGGLVYRRRRIEVR
jgi:hypothetical protein